MKEDRAETIMKPIYFQITERTTAVIMEARDKRERMESKVRNVLHSTRSIIIVKLFNNL